MPVVEFRGVSFEIGGRPILTRVDFSIDAGETLVLLGRSGSGKTTALKMTNALLLPTSGEVLVEGRSTTSWDPIELRRRIGYVIQEVGLFPHYTVDRNVRLLPSLTGAAEPDTRRRADELLTAVGLAPESYRDRYPRQLSGGQRQRVGVARALAAEPALLLFDEPFGALDPVTRLELQDQFLELRRGFQKTSIFVTHDVREALRLGTRVALLDKGRIDFLGTPQEFRAARTPESLAFLKVLAE